MKKLALAMAAAAALLFTAPVLTGVTTPAEAQTVVKKKVVIKHGDRGRHHGWERGRHRGWAHSRHRAGTKIVIKRGGGHHAHRTVIKKKTVVR
ncbi:MAG TPA: hypothetical protein VJT13_15450 [Xanthobacteraceae bacterium]|nr:hypothetical protein [Xanthobacteraceae bacterium]